MTNPSIDLKSVEGSSQIKAIGFDLATGTLAVQFQTGGTYHYHGVSQESFASLKAAKSIGSHLHANIKGKHKHTLIPAEKPKTKGKAS